MHEYTNAKVKSYTKLEVVRISKTEEIISKEYYLQKQTIQSEDLFFDPGWFGSEQETIYSLRASNDKLDPFNLNVIAIVGIGLDKFVVNHSRAIYNALDFVGDIGGLNDGLSLIAKTLVFVFAPGGMTSHLISKIFYTNP